MGVGNWLEPTAAVFRSLKPSPTGWSLCPTQCLLARVSLATPLVTLTGVLWVTLPHVHTYDPVLSGPTGTDPLETGLEVSDNVKHTATLQSQHLSPLPNPGK